MGGHSKGRPFEFEVLKQLKGNYSLLPIAFVCVFGLGLCGFQIIRTALRSPDVSINRVGNPQPYNKYLTEDGKAIRYKYFSTFDYSKMDSERPKI